jgi:tetratricopeptide (TPR) repeat protein
MDIIECYRLLELNSAASLEDIKTSYRRLARRLHPDVNPDNSTAQDQFIRITEAYKVLGKIAAARPAPKPNPAPEVKVTAPTPPSTPPSPQPTAPSQPEPAAAPPKATTTTPTQELSEANLKLKFETYRQLEGLIKRRSLPRAIAIIEALQSRLPDDHEVRQWQAIIYQQWGRQLISDRKLPQAKAYLQKAQKTDPHNKSLGLEIEADLRRIERKRSSR